MKKSIQSILGMNDCLPGNIYLYQQLENKLKCSLANYGFSEIRTPIIEQTGLFTRAIGTVSDVVEKQMYTFIDRDGNSITLRPENTVGCIRAGIEHGLLYNQQLRLWYLGYMFRHERPQMGRYRQFSQLGVEVFGMDGPDIDVELIIMTFRWWKELGIIKYLTLELNSLGSLQARKKYRQILFDYLYKNKHHLDDDCKRKMITNPLRILDSKKPNMQEIINNAPNLFDYLDIESKKHFIKLCNLLDGIGIHYDINHRLVRGLDYYNRTVFEWTTNKLGSQKTICAGGRYDSLVEQLGGKSIRAIGFAVGMERLLLLINQIQPNIFNNIDNNIDVYLISHKEINRQKILILAETIRDYLPTLKLMTHHGNNSIKKQLKHANKNKAKFAVIVVNTEDALDKIIIKNLYTGVQEIITQNNIGIRLMELMNERTTCE
uniref:Histidine--tRNA ligase n=1 Tax=Candidatus Aschnera chinzeii TaxID=1485666 RepID=A0AAT9G578_9ENTR|nr:MAG: histidine--tRNA ligase [Candidatus Aschnera chinzeii]